VDVSRGGLGIILNRNASCQLWYTIGGNRITLVWLFFYDDGRHVLCKANYQPCGWCSTAYFVLSAVLCFLSVTANACAWCECDGWSVIILTVRLSGHWIVVTASRRGLNKGADCCCVEVFDGRFGVEFTGKFSFWPGHGNLGTCTVITW